ncbi:cytochrome P450 [Artomyces pyxidatus]|uniref:Cytochrome P450 n=1 Tax=Artomyces pyxidatus TaxID=48021 RepID=A0ACB8SFK4_9AGAM|nr:cytochrome P450 [Artomyces pyxidatus]
MLDHFLQLDRSLPSIIWLSCLFATSVGATYLVFSFGRHRIRQMVLWDIPGPQYQSYLTGNFKQMFNPYLGLEFRRLTRMTYGAVSKFYGPLGDQILLISDPKALSSILLKNQDIFEETEWFTESFRHAFGPGLLSSTGALHRRQRKILNPIFSSQKVRSMVPLFHKISNELRDVLLAKLSDSPQEIEIVDSLGRLTLEMIAQGGLGYTFSSFDADAGEKAFGAAVKELSFAMAKLWIFRSIFPLISRWPSKVLRFGAAWLPLANVRYFIKLIDIIYDNTSSLLGEKKALLAEGEEELANQVGGGRDIVSTLLKTNIKAPEELKMNDDEILAQMAIFLVAGTDTTSTALCHTLLLLSQRQDVQDKLRQELNGAVTAADSDELGHDELNALPYLDAVCRETLRLHPPINFVTRSCRADTTIPLSQRIQGAHSSDSSLFVPRGTSIFVDILNVNRDQDIWGPDAATWQPERWLSPLPESVADARVPGVYSHTLSFLGGGRSCIGFKFAEMGMKVVLSQLIRTFHFSPSKAEIVWRFGPVTTPSVKGSTAVAPMMPIVVEKI